MASRRACQALAAACALVSASAVFNLAAALNGDAPGDAFGWALDLNLNETALLVGAAGVGGPNGGAIGIYTRSGGAWARSSWLTPNSSTSCFGGAAFGSALSASPAATPPVFFSGVYTSFESEGGAVVFADTGSGAWALTQQLCEATPGDELGASVAATAGGDALAVDRKSVV